ncbi:MAG: glycine--tRNA ligase subunit beta [Bryobacteraceae bacterium]|nr:glycine--tRNA ligase subunit beta [Bryobacteraceae bacterium]
MSARLPLLFEIGVEEIPHWMIRPALGEMERIFRELCEANRIEPGALRLDATPRRLVLRAEALPERQPDREELVLGPPKSAGEGAAQGFARKNGVTVAELSVEITPKGEYFALRKKMEGRAVREILAEILPEVIRRIPWPKTMYWTGKGGPTFIRPIRWIVALFGDQVVEFSFAGVQAGALTSGHRRLGAKEIVFDHATYEERLEKNGVILSAAKRRQRIEAGVKKLLKGSGLEWVRDEALLEDIVYLTEFPTPVMGRFDERFLELPREVLTTVMRHHQRYFTVQTAEGGLAPRFLAVMNMKADRKGYVVKGNERVLEARFTDAQFFWQVDRQKTLASRLDGLRHVTFQAKLGSYWEKTLGIVEGVKRLAGWLGLDAGIAERAAWLCKVDLMTEMVKEFPELQGVMGGLYARADGEPEEVAAAIYDHYLPQSMEDPIPRTVYGQILSVADKLDTLEGCFGIGLIPSGSKDPFALRRAAQGVVKVLVEGRLRIDLKQAVEEGMKATGALFAECGDGQTQALWEFFLDRIRYYFRDVRGFAYDEVNAVLAGDWRTLPDLESRLYALKLVRQTENFEPLAASFKRIRNILRQAGWQGGEVRAELLEAAEERALHEEASRVLADVRRLRASDDYLQALAAIATLRPAVDAFFDRVLVNAPDEAVRANRLALLGGLFHEVSSIADFSEIVTTTTTG